MWDNLQKRLLMIVYFISFVLRPICFGFCVYLLPPSFPFDTGEWPWLRLSSYGAKLNNICS